MSDNEIPEDAEDVGGGYFTRRGGYRELGNGSVELPSIRVHGEEVIQDGEQSAIKVKQLYFDDEGYLAPPPAPEVEAVVEEEVPEAAVVEVSSNQEAAAVPSEPVESIGQSVGYQMPGRLNEPLPTPPEINDKPQNTVTAVMLHESGFEISLPWKAAILTDTDNLSTGSLVLAGDVLQSLKLPLGNYEITVTKTDGDSFVYSALFQGQSFEHGLRYYTFLSRPVPN